MRTATINRKTAETDISLTLNIDGEGKADIQTGCGFLDHILTLFAHHGSFDVTLSCQGDTEVDYHHTTEDVGIALGDALRAALGDCRGIVRYGDITLPMDEALLLAAVDVSGRGMAVLALDIPTEKVGDFDTELVNEFFFALARRANLTLHIRQLAGLNSHHIIEGAFKATARALRAAVKQEGDKIPSTKGVL
ncbi:MAG: imidazoleglycerol-phosphate dehydratase HisB [Clostridia bacterium]|nr:imidazoleglycerol-phosphate dehydratase HisB [Clostridia bacterium]